MRTKIYTKPQIIDAAIKVVEKKGFSRFTARAIAKQMRISTQPIYLEFENMEDLKEQMIQAVFTQLFDEIFPKKRTGDPVVDIGVNFLEYANQKPEMFKALYVENYGNGEDLFQVSFKHFTTFVKEHDRYKDLEDHLIQNLHTRLWIVTVGLAVLTTSGLLDANIDSLTKTLEDFVDVILKNKNPILIS